jgi:uncharacterized protein (TIGR03437 family)
MRSTSHYAGFAFVCAMWLCMPLGADLSSTANAPVYSAASIVQGASQVPGVIAPNSIVTIYGSNLAFETYAATSSDLDGRNLPDSLAGVRVYANGLPCGLFYVSPGQVNFLVPYIIDDTTISIYLSRQALAGPVVKVPSAVAAPGIFQWNGNFAVAQHADGSLISPTSPAHGGEIVVIYATGLGRTAPDIFSGSVSATALTIRYFSEFVILLNGVACAPSDIYYAGVTPGFSGLYQVNVRLPVHVPPNPTIQFVMGGQASPSTVQLYVN